MTGTPPNPGPSMTTHEAKTETANDKLAALRQKKLLIINAIQKEERRAFTKKRKEETRLRVLLGVSILADLPHHPEIHEPIKKIVARGKWTKNEADFFKKHGWLDASYVPKAPKPTKLVKQ
jgi:hypothetical protein